MLGIVDWFVVTSGANPRQVRAISEEVDRELSGRGDESPRVEGAREAQWVLLDFGDVVVHVFQEEVRDYYQLERLWADVPHLQWEEDEIPDLAGWRAAQD